MSELVLTPTNDLLQQIESLIEQALAKHLRPLLKPTASVWLSNEQARAYLGGVSKATLARWRRDGRLPYSKVGGVLTYRRDDLDAFLEAHRRS